MKPLQTHLAQEIDDALKTGRPFAFAMFPGETDIMRFGSGQPSDGCSFDVSPWLGLFGNRIRIDISSSDFPEFSNHTNTVGNWAEQTETKIANQTIYIGGEYPSSVTLPTLSLGA